MFKSFSSITNTYFYLILVITIFISILFTPFIDNVGNINNTTEGAISKIINTTNIGWPLPGYTRISSPFGYRGAPTKGATNFHGGIDLPAPPGTNVVSAISGKVTKTGFMGSGGCSVVVENSDYTVVFHHISPNYLVKPGQIVSQGQVIAQVGPKNVYGFPNNPYKDSNRKSN